MEGYMPIKAKKSLGQNFLQDKQILQKIADTIPTDQADLIIEIGPGMGDLTNYLKAKNSYLICYEIDERLQKHLKPLQDNKTKIIFQDFLQADINKDIASWSIKDIYIIANIPYYITTPIIKKAINIEKLKSMTLLVQKEVAQRFTAKPKTKAYSSLTVFLNYYFDCTYLFDVAKHYFTPTPKVDSAVINFKRKAKQPYVKDQNYFFQLINDAFKMKRKTLKNNLNNYDWQKIENVLHKNNLSPTVRAEELSLSIFIEIANSLT